MIFDLGDPRNDVRWVFDQFCGHLDIRGERNVDRDLKFGLWLLVEWLRGRYRDEMDMNETRVVQIDVHNKGSMKATVHSKEWAIVPDVDRVVGLVESWISFGWVKQVSSCSCTGTIVSKTSSDDFVVCVGDFFKDY